MIRPWAVWFLAVPAFSCVGTTGSDLVNFPAYAAGPDGADPTHPLVFESGRAWKVTLTKAQMHIGAVYLNRSLPTSGAQETNCVLPGLYVADVGGHVDVDVLSGQLQPFAVRGTGTADVALAGEVWLMNGDVNAADDATVIVDLAGTAEKDGVVRPFDGKVSIGKNRAIPVKDPAQPGSNPICKQRIVSPIPIQLTPRNGGALLLRIDPRGWFSNVDFSALQGTGDPPTYRFADTNDNQPDTALFDGIRTRVGVYQFTWVQGAP